MKRITNLFLILALAFILFPGPAQAADYRIVQPGDTLYKIALWTNTTVTQLKQWNGLWSDSLAVGQKIYLSNPQAGPTISKNSMYTVKPGDSLWLISQRSGIRMDRIQLFNGLSGTEVRAGQSLYIPASNEMQPAKPAAPRQSGSTPSRGGGTARTNEDHYWLSRIISAEARGEIYEGQVAVGAVILNRVRSPQFPDSVKEVIFAVQPAGGGGYHEFQPVDDGTLYNTPTATAEKAAWDALNGWNPVPGALYFYNPNTAWSPWIRSRTVIRRIGNHVFAK